MGRRRNSSLFPIVFALFCLFFVTAKGWELDEEMKRLKRNSAADAVSNPGSGSAAGDGGNGDLGTIGGFLSNISPEARAELESITNNASLTKYELDNALDMWARKQGNTYYTVYRGLKNAYESARATLDQRHAERMRSQPQEVQDADSKLRAIVNNQFITPTEAERQIAELLTTLSPTIRAALLENEPYSR